MGTRELLVLLAGIIVLTSFTFGSVMAGDIYDPEVEDESGDTDDPQMTFRDIESAWFGEEGEFSLNISLNLVGEPPGLMDLANAQDTTVFEYEVYFDVEGTSYAVVCSVQYASSIGAGTPIGGVYSPTQTWSTELREVSYHAFTDVIQSETNIGDVSDFSYDSDDVILKWEVSKEVIGVLPGFDGIGQRLVNTWAAVWNLDDAPSSSQRDPEPDSWDYAQTHYSDPGEDYRIRGIGNVDYNVELSVDESEKITYGGTPAEYLVYVYNNGSQELTVELIATHSSETWNVSLDPKVSTIAMGTRRTIEVSVTPPKDVDNGSVHAVLITGNIDLVEGNGSVAIQDSVILTTTGLASSEEDDNTWLDIIMDSIMLIAAVIGVIILVIIILILVVIRRR